MAENPEKKIAIFQFDKNNEYRKKRLEELKKKFGNQKLLELINKGLLTDEDDEETVVKKINTLWREEVLKQMAEAGLPTTPEKKTLAQKIQEIMQNEELAEKEEKYIQKRRDLVEEKATANPERRSEIDDEIKACDEAHKKYESLSKLSEENNAFQVIEEMRDFNEETRKSLTTFAQQCQQKGKEGLFYEAAIDLQVSCITEEGEISFYPKGDKNRHSFNLTETGKIDHRIHNLGGTGLDMGLIDNELSLIANKDLTSEQLRALAEYCYRNGLDISDYKDLKDLKVLEEGREVGNVKDEMEKTLAELAGKEREVFNPENGNTGSVAAPAAPERGSFDKLYQFLPRVKTVDELDVDRSKMIEAAKYRMRVAGMGGDERLFRITRHSNSTIISVYANENDKLADGERDKYNKRIHSKQFAIELTHDRPPTGRFYMGQTKELKADHARMLLDAFKATGCKYFIMPNVAEIGGKMSGKAFMEASVKTGMVPYLKAHKGAEGSDVGLPDITTVFEAMEKEPDMKGLDKVEYMLRWQQELSKYCQDDPKRQDKFGTHLEKFKVGACFVKFQEGYLSTLQNHIEKGMRGEGEFEGKQWDKIDEVTSYMAMTQILKDIKTGQLDGRPYNPFANNEELIIQTFEKYRKSKRKGVEDEVENNRRELNKNNEVVEGGKVSAAVNTVLGRAKGELQKVCGPDELEGLGVKLSVKITPSSKNYQGRALSPKKRDRGRDDDD